MRRRLRDTVCATGGRPTRFDAVMAVCSSMVQYAYVKELAGTPLIVDLIDVDSQKWQDYADRSRGWKRWLYQLESRCVAALEHALLERPGPLRW